MKLFICFAIMLFANTEADCFQKEDTVVVLKNYYKIIEHGSFYFLIKTANESVRQIVFSYDIDVDKKQADITLVKDEYVDIIKDDKVYLPSKRWNKKQAGTFREKYFKIIDEDFLKMTHLEKISFLKKMAK